ncbi:hypothetical protein SK128_020512, partial [Halocaridina rubra]
VMLQALAIVKQKCPRPRSNIGKLFVLIVVSIVYSYYTTAKINLMDISILHKVKEAITSQENFNSKESYRKQLAEMISSVLREIQPLGGNKSIINEEWANKLAAVVEKLDPRISLLEKSTWDYSARLKKMGPAPKSPGIKRHVCPEVYFGNQYNHPWNQHGMEPEQCDYVPAFKTVLTAVLPATRWTSERVNFIAGQIRLSYDIPIVAIVASKAGIDKNIKNFAIKEIGKDDDEAVFMNEVIGDIKTPYVLLATNMMHFNNQSSLQRLVRVLDEIKHVQVAGGSARDLEGFWINGCIQQRMAIYEAVYAMGYYYSKFECMYCDDLLTPFVTTVQLIKDMPFTKGLKDKVLFRDWFATVKISGSLTLSCPDVMFYVSEHPRMTEEEWKTMAQIWHLEKISSYDENVYTFSCESIGITCTNPLNIISSYLLPPCCKSIMEKYMSYIVDYGRDNNLPFELQSGSALGAMKMGGYLPWDYDTDFVFECKDFNKWMEANKVLRPKGCNLIVIGQNKYMQMNCHYFFLELYCHTYNTTSQQYLPEAYQNMPTTIKYANRTVVSSANPGLHSRNRIGFDNLKHAAHWRTLKVTKEGAARGGYDNPGRWNKCKDSKHHSCLDKYPGDGSLPFVRPFLNL